MVAPFIKGQILAQNNFHYKMPLTFVRTGSMDKSSEEERQAYMSIPTLINKCP
jgi:hypothetical protein